MIVLCKLKRWSATKLARTDGGEALPGPGQALAREAHNGDIHDHD